MGRGFQVWKFHLKISLWEEKPCLPRVYGPWKASFSSHGLIFGGKEISIPETRPIRKSQICGYCLNFLQIPDSKKISFCGNYSRKYDIHLNQSRQLKLLSLFERRNSSNEIEDIRLIGSQAISYFEKKTQNSRKRTKIIAKKLRVAHLSTVIGL